MFFHKFEKVQYDPYGEQAKRTATNVMNSLLVKYNPVDNTTVYFYHLIKYGETPEYLAQKYYGNAYYHWVIIVLNTIVDPWFDWYLNEREFRAFLTMRYGAGNEDAIHHLIDLTTNKRLDEVATLDAYDYYDTNGMWPVNVGPVGNAQFELEANNDRREVKILQQKYVRPFINQFEDLMNRRTFA